MASLEHGAPLEAEELALPQAADPMSDRGLFIGMLFSALLSLTAALVLSIDAWKLAGDPASVFACDLNSVVSCGKVAASWQAELLGFPNAFIGLMCEPVVVTLAVAGLAGVKFPRWFMNTAQAVYLAGLIFAYWLFYEAVAHIGALCPWCLCITVGTTLVFFTLLRYNIRHGHLPGSAPEGSLWKRLERVGFFLVLPLLMLLTVAAIIFLHYGMALFS